jgi:hypothetical protein
MSDVVLATLGGADVFGLIASAIVVVYLLYALLRGEKL